MSDFGPPQLIGRTILIGDAGLWGHAAGDPGVARLLAHDIGLAPTLTTAVWLGDNVYGHGLPPAQGDATPPGCIPDRPDERRYGEATLTAQMEATKKSALTLFVTGNHDWWAPGACAVARRQAQARFINDRPQPAGRATALAPKRPCPGPDVFPVRGFRIIAFDSEWLLRESDALADACTPGQTYAQVSQTFWQDLEREVLAHGGRTVVLVSHHPVRSHGEHGGRLNPRHLYLDVLRRPFVNQDLAHPRYQRLITHTEALITRALAADPAVTVVHAAGHEHNLEVIAHPSSSRALYVVSGSASKLTPAGSGRDTLFSDSVPGYIVLDRIATTLGERVFLEVVGPALTGTRTSHYSTWIGRGSHPQ